MKLMKVFVDSLEKAETKIKRHSKQTRHAEAIKERLFQEKFFRSHCAYEERRGKEPAEFNFSATGPLKELLCHPLARMLRLFGKKYFITKLVRRATVDEQE